jgi:nitrogen PTS system EIIA component
VKISDILDPSMVLGGLSGSTKDEVLGQLAEHLSKHPRVAVPVETIHAALLNRERLGSTGVGDGVAIPHAKIPGLTELVACFARAAEGVPFDAIDQKPVRLLFVLLVPENSAGAHLKALARISRLLRSPEFRGSLLHIPTAATIYEAFVTEDAKH